MSIAAANLFTRNIYREWLKPDATPRQEAQVSKLVSLVVKFVALLFVLFLDRQNAINFQLLGGIWILQTFPAIVFGLYTRWLHRWALLAGWAVAMVYGTWKAYGVASPATKHFGGSTANIGVIGQIGYIGSHRVRAQPGRRGRRDGRASGPRRPRPATTSRHGRLPRGRR